MCSFISSLFVRDMDSLSPPHQALRTQRFLQRLLNIKWDSFTQDTEFLKRTNICSIEQLISRNQMCWVGHVKRMDHTHLPKRQHRPKKRFKDNVKTNLKNFKINVKEWENLADDCPTWRRLIHEGSKLFECKRICHAEIKRALCEKILLTKFHQTLKITLLAMFVGNGSLKSRLSRPQTFSSQ